MVCVHGLRFFGFVSFCVQPFFQTDERDAGDAVEGARHDGGLAEAETGVEPAGSGSTPNTFESVRRTCVPPAVSCTAVRADTSVTATPSRSRTPVSDRLASMGLVLHALTQWLRMLISSIARPPEFRVLLPLR